MVTMSNDKWKFLFPIFTCICGLSLVVWLVYLATRLFKAERLKYIRNFKKGAFTVPLIPAFVLFFISNLRNGEITPGYFVKSFLNSLTSTISLMGLKFEFDKLEPYLTSNCFFRTVVYTCFVIVVFNVFLFAFSLFQQRFRFWNHSMWRSSPAVFNHKNNVCFIYGKNERSLKIYESDDNYCKTKFLIDDFKASGDEDLFFRRIRYAKRLSLTDEAGILENYLSACRGQGCRFLRIFRKNKEMKKFFIIVNYEDDKKNIELCQILSKTIAKAYKDAGKDESLLEKMVKGLSICVIGIDELDSVYQEVESHSFGCLHYYNKYRMMGNDLMTNHPITQFMNENQIDYDCASLKPGVRLTFSIIGFGKTNRFLFNNLVSDVQFNRKTTDNKFLHYVPEFYLYDKKDNLHTPDLNHNYFRYEEFYKENKESEDYLELPPLPADLHKYAGCGVDSPDLYKKLKEGLKKEKTDFNFIYVAFGSDLENIEMAKKLYEKGIEWNIPNLVIFVKANSIDRDTTVDIRHGGKDKPKLVYFGENGVIYSFRNIISGFVYNLTTEIDSLHGGVDKNKFNNADNSSSYKRWFKETTYEFDRLSSFASAMSIFNKLGMLGLKIADKGKAITEEEFNRRYNDIARKNLAESQHLRWNAYMICQGYIPSTKEQILSYGKDQKDLDKKREYEHLMRQHCNLTTIKGLAQYVELTKETDVYDYDYVMDKCYEIVGKLGKKIVEKV